MVETESCDVRRAPILKHTLKWKTLAVGLSLRKTIDTESIALIDTEKIHLRDILHRLNDITLLLAKQKLPFCSYAEYESSLNKANFLEMVEMLSKYDPVPKEHLITLKQSTCKVKVSTAYLPSKSPNVFKNILGNRVKELLLKCEVFWDHVQQYT